MKQALGNEKELYWLFVRWLICERITAEKRNGMNCVDCGMERLIHLCCAVLRWVKWTKRNVVKGGREVRHEQRPPKRNEWREWTYRKHMQIKLDLFFLTATIEREEGNIVGLSGSGAGQSVDFVRLLYIIRLWASLLICRQARERT